MNVARQPGVPEMYWSYSALTTFENCPRKYWATRVSKVVSDIAQPNIKGDEEHQAIEHFFKKGLRLPVHLREMEPLFQHLIAAPGEQYIEFKMCLNEQLQVADAKKFDKTGWVRGAADYVKINGTLGTYLDWKSGKPGWEVEDQIDLTALLLFRHFPALQRVNGGLYYYNHNKVKPHVVHRVDEQRLWNGFYSRVNVMLQAKREDNYPATPNKLCEWCPYRACPHNAVDARLAREAAKQG